MQPFLINQSLKTQKTLKELEIMCYFYPVDKDLFFVYNWLFLINIQIINIQINIVFIYNYIYNEASNYAAFQLDSFSTSCSFTYLDFLLLQNAVLLKHCSFFCGLYNFGVFIFCFFSDTSNNIITLFYTLFKVLINHWFQTI